MKNNKILNSIVVFVLILIFSNQKINAQKIDTDSLLTVIVKDMQNEKNYAKNIQRALMAKKIAPNYLDYYLILGRNHDLLKNKDSAAYYYNYFIKKTNANEDAFNYLINIELEKENYTEAEKTIEQAIQMHPDNRDFQKKKIVLYQVQKETKKEYNYIQSLQVKYPNDPEIKQSLFLIESKINADRLGINYSYTTFNREGYGPWHLGSIQYIRERGWGSLIGRVNYANRLSSGESIAEGKQFEAESYFFTGKNNYSYVSIAYSPDLVFPRLRVGYSFYQNFKKGWEADLGLRYIESETIETKIIVLGVGKYIGSYWINFRSYLQNNDNEYNPSFALTTRYYLDTKYDYFSVVAGYGTSPDERTTLGQFEQRVSLNSFRIGAGYNRLINNHYLAGIQTTFNNQEYAPNLKQNELEISLMFQYKF
ncbi:YaiO family outer membrane beta-barrel protein [Flavobacterium sp. KS-LB2]|uniref:YaiO family outer membrane beta-barrel protein n=1 Tax=Flavobacterium sp. KS-LB2 TaxID=3120525 RepID=UPI0030D433AB